MDIDYQTEKGEVFLEIKEDKKERRKKQKKVLVTAIENLRWMVFDKLNGRMGDS